MLQLTCQPVTRARLRFMLWPCGADPRPSGVQTLCSRGSAPCAPMWLRLKGLHGVTATARGLRILLDQNALVSGLRPMPAAQPVCPQKRATGPLAVALLDKPRPQGGGVSRRPSPFVIAWHSTRVKREETYGLPLMTRPASSGQPKALPSDIQHHEVINGERL